MTRPDARPGDATAEILVVCTANIVRSPFGEALLQAEAIRRLGPFADVWVRSAGVRGMVGEGAVEAMREESAKRGLSLDHHRARSVEREEVERVDLVLTMTERHRARLAKVTPAAPRYTFTFKELVRLTTALKPLDPGLPPRERLALLARIAHGARAYVARPPEPEDVTDPIGGPREGYTVIASEIEDLVRRLGEPLFGPHRADDDEERLFGRSG